MIINDITESIGNTPLLRLAPEITQLKNIDLYLKLEFFNPFGSLKDRIAWGMLKDTINQIKANGQGIIENSSGNTAKAIAVLAKRAGVPFKLVSAMVKVKETKDILKLLGVELEDVSGSLNCYDPSDPNDPQYIIERQVARADGKLHFTSQFTNKLNPETHKLTTAEELINDLGKIDYFCSGLGTAGSTLGIAERLRKENPNMKLIGIVAGKSDYIPGIRTVDQLLEAGIFEPSKYDELVTVESQQAVDGVLNLIQKCGVLGGPSSGAHIEGTLSYLRMIDAGLTTRATAVTIVCDRVEWYLSYIKERRPDLFGEKRKPYSIYNLGLDEIHNAPAISYLEAESWAQENDALVVDIRANIAFAQGSFPGAINIPSELLEKLLESKNSFASEDKKVLFVCPVGDQSKKFAAQLTRIGGQGFSLHGGLLAWRSNNTNNTTNNTLRDRDKTLRDPVFSSQRPR
jgi:cysteine synthase B